MIDLLLLLLAAVALGALTGFIAAKAVNWYENRE